MTTRKPTFGAVLTACLTIISLGAIASDQALLTPSFYDPSTSNLALPKVRLSRDLTRSEYSVGMSYAGNGGFAVSSLASRTTSNVDFDAVEYNPLNGEVKIPYLKIVGDSSDQTYLAVLQQSQDRFIVRNVESVPNTTIQFDVLQTRNADSRIDYAWMTYVPSTLSRSGTNYIVVEGSAGLQSDNYADVVTDAQRAAGYWGPKAGAHGFIYLRPVFPAPAIGVGISNISDYARYPQGLYRGALMTATDFKYRPDLRLNKMIDTLRHELAEMGYPVSEKVFLYGFSISGAFAARYPLLHPDRVKATAPGSPGFMPIPADAYNGQRINWPVGTADIRQLTGIRVDLEKLKQIPVLLFIGDRDTTDPVPSSTGVPSSYVADEAALWPTSGTTYLRNQAKFIHDNFGVDQAQRMRASHDYLRSAGIPISLRVYPNVAHTITQSMYDDVFSFFLSNR